MMSAACQFMLEADFKDTYKDPGSIESDLIFGKSLAGSPLTQDADTGESES